MHQRYMWLGSGANASRAYGSHALAHLLATFEQVSRLISPSPHLTISLSYHLTISPSHHLTIYHLATFEQAVLDSTLPKQPPLGAIADDHAFWRASMDSSSGSGTAAGDAPPRIVSVFAHDFNLLFLRQLLRLHWVMPTKGYLCRTR